METGNGKEFASRHVRLVAQVAGAFRELSRAPTDWPTCVHRLRWIPEGRVHTLEMNGEERGAG